ncbi:MAG: serine/threonine protein phosphatase [Candidatus Bathyarchaeota archaeon]|nr:MAG: serine/threonine protein phosphatase [Candidatus Bathyarchaeota archaeon]
MVMYVVINVEEPSDLIDMAKKIDVNEFLQLVENAIQLLAKENGQIGNMQITGRLVSTPSVGEAIVVGDIHGDLESLMIVLKDSDFMKKSRKDENVTMIFLGDYGDRGLHSPEVYNVILKLKELFPKHVILMRGNHEGPDDLLAHPHDLPAHLQRKFGDMAPHVYMKIRELFSYLYNVVLIEGRYVFLHGGVPSQASTIEDLAFAHEKHPREIHLEEILWSDPREGIRGTYPSPRGAGRLFGEDITEKLLRMLNVKVLIRGHEPTREGFKINQGGKILTLFSRRGPPYYNEFGAYLHLNLSKKVENATQLIQYIHKF